MILEKLQEYLENEGKNIHEAAIEAGKNRFVHLIKRQFMEDRKSGKGRIYPSSVGGKCARKLAYQYHGYEREEFPARKHLQWFIGDLAELGVLSTMKAAGLDVGLNNEYIPVEFGEHELHGFIDGLLHHEGETYLLEVKSKTHYGFKRFQSNGPDNKWGNLSQANLYMKTLDLDRAVYFVVDRSTGKMCEHLMSFDEEYVEWARRNFAEVMESTEDNLPDRFVSLEELDWHPQLKCYELGTVCSYCDYKKYCWPKAEKEIVGGKPEFRIYREKVGE